MIVWTPAVLSVLYARVLYFCICTCSAQLSISDMERRSRNTPIIIIIIIIIKSAYVRIERGRISDTRGKRSDKDIDKLVFNLVFMKT